MNFFDDPMSLDHTGHTYRVIISIILSVSVLLLIPLCFILLSPGWTDERYDRQVFNPNKITTIEGEQGYIEKWEGDEQTPPIDFFETVSQNDNPDQKLFQIKRSAKIGYAGFDICLDSPMQEDDSIILTISNQGEAFEMEISLIEKESPGCAIPEDWQTKIYLPSNTWTRQRILLSNFKLNEDYQPLNKVGNQKLDIKSLDHIAFVLPPDKSINILLGSIFFRSKQSSIHTIALAIIFPIWLFLVFRDSKKNASRQSSLLNFINLITLLTYLFGSLSICLLINQTGELIGNIYGLLTVLSIISLFHVEIHHRINADITRICSFVFPMIIALIIFVFDHQCTVTPLFFAASCFLLIAHFEISGLMLGLVYLVIFLALQVTIFSQPVNIIGISIAFLIQLFFTFFVIYIKHYSSSKTVKMLEQKKEEIEKKYKDLMEHKSQLQKTLEQFQKNLWKDELTDVANYSFFEDHYQKLWRHSLRHKIPVSIAICDIDNFSDFNQSFNSKAGDACLKWVAMVLNASYNRPFDIVARKDNEDVFIMLSCGVPAQETAYYVDTVRQKIERLGISNQQTDTDEVVTVSIGVSGVIPSYMTSPEKLFSNAYDALKKAKEKGKNLVMLHIHIDEDENSNIAFRKEPVFLKIDKQDAS